MERQPSTEAHLPRARGRGRRSSNTTLTSASPGRTKVITTEPVVDSSSPSNEAQSQSSPDDQFSDQDLSQTGPPLQISQDASTPALVQTPCSRGRGRRDSNLAPLVSPDCNKGHGEPAKTLIETNLSIGEIGKTESTMGSQPSFKSEPDLPQHIDQTLNLASQFQFSDEADSLSQATDSSEGKAYYSYNLPFHKTTVDRSMTHY